MKSSDSFSPIRELLIAEGFVEQNDIQRAYEIRDENIKKAALPLELILVREGHLLKADLNHRIAHGEIQHKIEATLVEKGMVRKEDLEKHLFPGERWEWG